MKKRPNDMPIARDSSRQALRQIAAPPEGFTPEQAMQIHKFVYLDLATANVLKGQMDFTVGDESANGADGFVAAIKASMQPRDAVEEMLMCQMALVHARILKLSDVACKQENRENVRVVNEAADRAANTFRKQMLALAEYRQPRKQFVAIRQLNQANNQQVNNHENEKSEEEKPTNEQRCPAPKALPAVVQGVEVTAGGDPQNAPVAAQHRAKDAGREGQVTDERVEARAQGRGEPGDVGGSGGSPSRRSTRGSRAASSKTRRRRNA